MAQVLYNIRKVGCKSVDQLLQASKHTCRQNTLINTYSANLDADFANLISTAASKTTLMKVGCIAILLH